ncbi:hypothetical protein GJ654_18835 [Rhodoblastus acidophilus]|uniref:Uncharacterized protein n=1 Tax=Rhodoblastus acidophilus TaxID=1074 RepID=A0A6N8DR44_RHOAC|nr:baseplate J/gp47 family protein [Rhodoblastus acidophilus]MCW2276385.1 putative phage protein gp47/JayE [Rhodoblastus acidophilus]MTV33040.1 hypothetical protein [Rhodoblastus acidophilus]
MPLTVRTLDALGQWARGLFAKAVDGAVVSVWPNTWSVLGKVLAPVAQAFEQRMSWLWDQIFVSRATDVAIIGRHGYELGVSAIPAVAATGSATCDAVSGLVIPRGVQFQRPDGALFSTASEVTASGASVVLPLVANVAGAAGNTAAATELALVYPDDTPQLGAVAIVGAGGLGGGADAEGKEAWRARILEKKRKPPNGGSVSDWQKWARASSAGVAWAWVDSFSNSTRQVWIAFARSDRALGAPSGADVAAMRAALGNPNQRPVTARPTVVGVTPAPVPVTLTRVIPDTPAIRAGIALELQALFTSYNPVDGAHVAPATPNSSFVLPVDWIDEAIGRTPGLLTFTRVAPAGDITYYTPGRIPAYQAPSYV